MYDIARSLVSNLIIPEGNDAGDGTSAHNRNGAGDESEDDEDNDDDDWSDGSDLEENLPLTAMHEP